MSVVVAPLGVLWPVAALLVALDGRRRPIGWIAVAALGVAFVVLLATAVDVSRGGMVETVVGGWPADVGIRLRADGLGITFALVSCGVLLAALVHATVSGGHGRLFPALVLFLGIGLTGLFLTADVFSFYVFFELAMIAAYALAAAGGQRAVASAFIFAVVNLLGSFLFLIGIAALYRVAGTLEMDAAAERLAGVEPTTALLIAVTFFVAFCVKLGLFPFHFWLPTVYASTVPAVAAILAGALANIGGYGLLRFGAGLMPRELALTGTALIAIGTISIAYGALQAIGRRDTREVLAYSAIGHAGYILVALGLGGPVALAAAVLFTIVNALNKALLFLCADVRGPVVAASFAIGAFSVAGVPPAAGFFGKAALFDAGVSAGSVVTVALLFVGGALSFVYLFQVYQHDHWRPLPGPRPRASRGVSVVVGGVAAVVLVVGVWPEPVIALCERAAEDLRPPAPR